MTRRIFTDPRPPLKAFAFTDADRAKIRAGELGVCDLATAENPEKPTRTRRTKEEQKTNPYEDRIHTSIVKDLRRLVPDEVVWWSNENRFNGAFEGKARKDRGCIAGEPDMQFHYCGRTLFVEIKDKKGGLNDAQKHMFSKLEASGFTVAVCRSITDVLAALIEAQFPTRVVA